MNAAAGLLAILAMGAALLAWEKLVGCAAWAVTDRVAALAARWRRRRRAYRPASDPARYGRLGWRRTRPAAERVPDAVPLAQVERVLFYKRDLLTVDLVCCDVAIGGRVLTFHEEAPDWDRFLRHIGALPDFRADWRDHVLAPSFATCPFTAFRRD